MIQGLKKSVALTSVMLGLSACAANEAYKAENLNNYEPASRVINGKTFAKGFLECLDKQMDQSGMQLRLTSANIPDHSGKNVIDGTGPILPIENMNTIMAILGEISKIEPGLKQNIQVASPFHPDTKNRVNYTIRGSITGHNPVTGYGNVEGGAMGGGGMRQSRSLTTVALFFSNTKGDHESSSYAHFVTKSKEAGLKAADIFGTTFAFANLTSGYNQGEQMGVIGAFWLALAENLDIVSGGKCYHIIQTAVDSYQQTIPAS